MKKCLKLLCMILMLASCASSKEDAVSGISQTAEQLYKQGYQNLQKTAYVKAAENFEKIEYKNFSPLG